MVDIIKASGQELEQALAIRYEMLREVNNLLPGEKLDSELKAGTRYFFNSDNQTTLLAMDNDKAIGCATLCYIKLMPTFDHPLGNRANLMNVYVKSEYRKQGIAKRMVELLIEEARTRLVSEISLDATTDGRPLYEALGFTDNSEGMVLLV